MLIASSQYGLVVDAGDRNVASPVGNCGDRMASKRPIPKHHKP
ncbi:hypothetical protein ACQ4N7_27040 [Nodosilinea sp. AN01ver1]